jgi:hypothetical protein
VSETSPSRAPSRTLVVLPLPCSCDVIRPNRSPICPRKLRHCPVALLFPARVHHFMCACAFNLDFLCVLRPPLVGPR